MFTLHFSLCLLILVTRMYDSIVGVTPDNRYLYIPNMAKTEADLNGIANNRSNIKDKKKTTVNIYIKILFYEYKC